MNDRIHGKYVGLVINEKQYHGGDQSMNIVQQLINKLTVYLKTSRISVLNPCHINFPLFHTKSSFKIYIIEQG